MVSAATRGIVCLGGVAVLVLSLFSLSFGGAAGILGPKDYVRAKGKPATVAEHFAVSHPDMDYILRIDNGGMHGGFAKVSSAVILLNGVQVAGPSDFNQMVTQIEKPVRLRRENRLSVELRGQPGAGLTVWITGVVQETPPVVTIIEPVDQATVPEGQLVVRGTVDASGAEVGVTVNDVPAVVQGNAFATLLAVTPGPTPITAVATTDTGATARHTIGVSVGQITDPTLITLRAHPWSGVAPLTVTFSLVGGPVPTAVDLDLNGDGGVEFSGPSIEGETFSYLDPGLFFPRISVTDANGNQFTTDTMLQVLDLAALDALLQAKWAGIKDALRAGNVAQAVAFIHTESRDTYGAQLGQIHPVALTNIDQYMTAIQLVEVGPGGAQYEMLRDRNGQTLSFAVWFQLDGDGIWRLRRF